MKLELPDYHYCTMCGSPLELQNSEGRKRPVCTSCGHIVYVNPLPAITVIVLNERQVLLTLRGIEPHRNEWCLPGGFLEWGETPKSGGRRELLEETGLEAGEMSLVGVYNSVSTIQRHVILIAYRVLSWTGKTKAGDDAVDVRWFGIDRMPPLAFKSHIQALSDVLKGAPLQ